VKLAQESCPPYRLLSSRSNRSSNSLSVAPLFSYRYESIFPQLLSFHIDLNPWGCGSHALTAHTSNPANPLFPITSVQPSPFHAFTHSFAQRRATIYPILNSFRTLSIATAVVPPAMGNTSTSTSTSATTRRELRITERRGAQSIRTPRRSDIANVPTFHHSAKIHPTPL
jgi:hypothetical protein